MQDKVLPSGLRRQTSNEQLFECFQLDVLRNLTISLDGLIDLHQAVLDEVVLGIKYPIVCLLILTVDEAITFRSILVKKGGTGLLVLDNNERRDLP